MEPDPFPQAPDALCLLRRGTVLQRRRNPSSESVQRYISEQVVPNSTAKHARGHRSQYMVGALARVNNNHAQLSPLALEGANDVGIKLPCYNPFANTLAQIVECAHCIEDSIRIIDILLDRE